ncbi:hypothetical protein KSD_92920 [Ktedonobacter sp. SOSP1-85]|uniref:Tn3 family transposase n=1 Tax=Ktedonobacter sp. SOSP1-85 TaxID=2778367 RepID=UPI001915AF1A|nr:hypothetical protein KSD_92920 [Ktedonobacter sp. SOSP1-85]
MQKLREVIHSTTNKVEQFNAFSKWLFFGGEGRIGDNTPKEQEKRICSSQTQTIGHD